MIIVAALCLAYAVAFLDRALIGIVAAPIKAALQLTDTQFGLMHGFAFVALYCLCGIPLGWLADRYDRRLMIAAGILVWSLATLLCGVSTSAAAFFIGRIGVGVGEAVLVPAGMSLLASVVSRAAMARSVAVFLMGATLGNAAALLGGGLLLDVLSSTSSPAAPLAPWQQLFIIAASLGLGLVAAFLLIREPERVAPRVASQTLRESVEDALRQMRASASAYGLLTGATACSVMLAQAQGAWTPLFFTRRFGLAPGDSAVSVGIMFLLSAPLGQWAGGVLMDRLHARGVRTPAHHLLLLCAATAVVPAFVFCHAGELWVSRSAYLAFNFLVFAATPAGLTGWQLLTPARLSGMTIALLVSVVTLIGAGFGPALVGAVTDHVLRSEAALGTSLFIVISVSAAGCCLFALAGRSSYRRALDQRMLERLGGEVNSVRAAASSCSQRDASPEARPL